MFRKGLFGLWLGAPLWATPASARASRHGREPTRHRAAPAVALNSRGKTSMRNAMTIITMTALASFAVGGCEKKNDPQHTSQQTGAASAATSSQVPAHARSGVRPGSHEDWCGEHQVPESLCTRCNPSLIAAFKATGDWCEEHGLPESQCRICNPKLKIERPPRSGETSP